MRISFSGERVAGFTIAGVVLACIGAVAGSAFIDSQRSEPTPTMSPTPDQPRCLSLASMNLIGMNNGHINAKNTGECFGLYDVNTRRDIGATVAKGEAFVVDCWDYKPTAFKVET